MLQLRYDEDFLEAAVFLTVSGLRLGVPSLQIARFHREREKLYSLLDPDERSAAFFRLHLDWFREWGLEKLLMDVLHEFPQLAERLTLLAVRKTHGKDDEGAELYVNAEGQRTGLLALRMERLLRDDALTDYLRHELMHLDDMLDPAFGYAPALDLPGLNSAQVRLARERYRLLWDITIDGRLAARGHLPLATCAQHRAAFSRGYSFWPEAQQLQVFESLWQSATPCHTEFLALISDPRGLRQAHLPMPGGSCPLCAFSTFTWADARTLPSGMVSRIQAEFPAWSTEQGLCHRCLETYQSRATLGDGQPLRAALPEVQS